MKILVINTGSSSIKYELFDMDRHHRLAGGIVERIGEDSSVLTHQKVLAGGDIHRFSETNPVMDHGQGLERAVEILCDPDHGVIVDKDEITAVGHRVVHGGETFKASTIIDENVIAAIREFIPLAPLHNPPNLKGIEVARAVFPKAAQVAVFDTAFHQTIPPHAYMYAIPMHLYEKERVRKYGFHGTSHAYVAEQAASFLDQPLDRANLITIHLGNGGSMAAIKNGQCVDTTMGMTPLAGLVMGTRCGDMDPAIPVFLADHLSMGLEDIDALLNKKSGLKGLCGTNDMRELMEMQDKGDNAATIALEIYTYRIKKYIGAYFAVLGKLDAIVFTAGIGENSPVVRQLSCQGLEGLGIMMDDSRNNGSNQGVRVISTNDSPVKILVIPTNEELCIAQETQRVVSGI